MRVGVLHDDAADVAALTRALMDGGLPPVAGVRSDHAGEELVGKGVEVVVLAAFAAPADGLQTLRMLRRTLRGSAVVAVAEDRGGGLPRQTIDAGAAGFVPTAQIGAALVPAVLAAAAGLVCVPRERVRLVARPSFSQREKQALALVAAGLSNREIASRLHLAESTIKGHLVTAFDKLGVRSRREATALMLDPDERLLAAALAPVATRAGRAPVRKARSAA